MHQAFDMNVLARLSDEVGEIEASAFVRSFSDTLEERLIRIDLAHPVMDPQEWSSAVTGLGTSANRAGAQRIEQTCANLLAINPSDVCALEDSKGRLRTDGRIFALAFASFLNGQTLA